MANSTINQLEYHGTLYDVEDTAARTGLETKADTDDVNAALSGKVDKVQGKGLSTNDYTDNEKTKLAGIAEGAEVNVQSDWNQTTTTADDYIKNKPTIPTVNDSTITIQKNRVTVDSFTTNAATGKTINITVPTTASEVDALPDTTKYGASLSLTIDSSTYVVTAQLKDQNGDNLGQAQTIDLPLESVVVSGSYNSQTKKVVLTLQSGSTVEFSVADLVAGLQSEITANNPLSSDLVDDTNATHKFVSASEKNTWNSKQDTISDLSTIRSGASAGATAVQPAALNDYATTAAMDTALSGKQDALSQAQLSAVNSGATTAKIDQIETNKNNISMLETMQGKKNYLQLAATINVDGTGITATKNSDNSISINGTSTSTCYVYLNSALVLPAGTYVMYCPQANTDNIQMYDNGTWNAKANNTRTFDGNTSTYIIIRISSGQTISNVKFYPMILTDTMYSSGLLDYQPYAMTNAEITAWIQAHT